MSGSPVPETGKAAMVVLPDNAAQFLQTMVGENPFDRVSADYGRYRVGADSGQSLIGGHSLCEKPLL
jgi:hypothetical protein